MVLPPTIRPLEGDFMHIGAMQSVSYGTVIPLAGCRGVTEAEGLSSSSSEVYINRQHGRNFLECNSGKGRAVWIAHPGPVKSRADLGLKGSPKGAGGLVFPKERGSYSKVSSSLITGPPDRSAEQKVYDVVAKQASMFNEQMKQIGNSQSSKRVVVAPELLSEAYARCGEVCAEYAKTFYLGTKLMTPERQRAIWAIYVWCRRTDELVDGPNASRITPTALDRWEERLEDVFRGQPYDMLDAALSDTVSRFPVDIQPFRDMIDGMRMDLVKPRYSNFDELYLYCYNVAGTVGLMSVPVMGISPDSKATTESVYNAALALGIANQLTNILRDVGEDARRQRIYLPQDELRRFDLTDEDIFAGIVTDKWRAFMKDQISRARMFFKEAEAGVGELDKDSRWPVWASLILYQKILDGIETNDYDNFTKRAYVGKWRKLVLLPAAYGRALVKPPSSTTRRLIRA